MLLLYKASSSKLNFAKSEPIQDGVEVHPVQFGLGLTQPPFKATYFHVLPGCITPVDTHLEKEMWIVLQGQGILNFEGESYSLAQHDIYYFESFKTHQVFNNANDLLIICSLYW